MIDRNSVEESESRSIEKATTHAKVWIVSEEGRRGIMDSLRTALETTTRLQEVRRVDPKILHEPVSRRRMRGDSAS